MAVQKVNVGQVQNRANVQVGANKKDVGNKNVLAKGVGLLKKAWLHLSGGDVKRHSTQLKNLKAQVRNSFGTTGLSNLNDYLKDKGWNLDGSTKLLSGREIKKTIGHVQLQDTKNKLSRDFHVLLGDPKMSAILDDYGKSDYTQENIDFLRAMTQIKRGSWGREVDTDKMKEIIKGFIGEKSGNQVNISSRQAKKILKAEKNLNEALMSNDRSKIDTAKDELLKGLYKAREEIGDLVHRNLPNSPTATKLGIVKNFNQRLEELAIEQLKPKLSSKPLSDLGMAVDRPKKPVRRNQEPVQAAPKKGKVQKSPKKEKQNVQQKKVQVDKKPDVKVQPNQVNKEAPVVQPKPVKVKAKKKVAPKKAPDPRAKIKKFLGRTPGIRNHPQLNKLTNAELDQINKLVAEKKELLAINKAKEFLRGKVQ